MKLETVALGSISPDPANTRKHSRRNLDAIKASLRRFGQQKPIVVDAKGVVLAGNGTLAAATELGWEKIQIIRTALAGVDATAFGIADNRTAELAEWDQNLGDVLASLKAEDFPLAEIGFDEADLAELAGEPPASDADAEPQIDKAEELRAKWGVEMGQIWQLGEHRLLCGDSTNQKDVDRLMNGERCDTLFTSPPYGAGNVAQLRDHHEKGKSKRESFYDLHEDAPDQWPALMAGWFDAFRPHCDVVACNIQLLADNKRELMKWIVDRSDDLCDVIIWDKGHGAPQMAANVLSNAFEFIFVFGGNGSRAIPFGNFHGTISNIVRINPHGKNEFAAIHRAVFPIELPRWAVGELFQKAKTVAEPFCGTGTTMIACEQLGRKCRAIEISPAYVAVAIQRWADATGKEPRKL